MYCHKYNSDFPSFYGENKSEGSTHLSVTMKQRHSATVKWYVIDCSSATINGNRSYATLRGYCDIKRWPCQASYKRITPHNCFEHRHLHATNVNNGDIIPAWHLSLWYQRASSTGTSEEGAKGETVLSYDRQRFPLVGSFHYLKYLLTRNPLTRHLEGWKYYCI